MIESNIQTILYFIDDKLIFRLFRYFDRSSFQKCIILKWNCFCDFLWFWAEQPETLPRIAFQLASEFRVMKISCPSGLDVLYRPGLDVNVPSQIARFTYVSVIFPPRTAILSSKSCDFVCPMRKPNKNWIILKIEY